MIMNFNFLLKTLKILFHAIFYFANNVKNFVLNLSDEERNEKTKPEIYEKFIIILKLS